MSEVTKQQRWRPAPLIPLTLGLHAAALAALTLTPVPWPWAVGPLVANHLVLGLGCVWPRSQLLGPSLNRLPASRARAGEVALTFDDGPDPQVTPQVLELLAAHRARASFFCIGRRAQEHPEMVAEMVRRGHRVENHTQHHSHAFALRGWRAMAREIDRAQEVLAELSGRPPVFFRAPAGMRSPLLGPLLARRGLRLVSWTRRGFDAVVRDPAWVARRLVHGLAAGDVLLLHDGSPARDRGGRPVVLEALPRVLEAMAARGLSSQPLPATGWEKEEGIDATRRLL